MGDELLCIKVRDGLYIGNRAAAEDIDFLLTNKFSFLLNCTAEVKNYFQQLPQLNYCKLKYDRNRNIQRLWKDPLKKSKKIISFINLSVETGQCCLVYSSQGNNRAVAVVAVYLMCQHRWTLQKTFNFLSSKHFEMKLSAHFLSQLQELEEMLLREGALSNGWVMEAATTTEELIITNTYLNTIEIKYEQKFKQVSQTDKRVQWKDRLQKSKKHIKINIDNQDRPRSSLTKSHSEANARVLILNKGSNLVKKLAKKKAQDHMVKSKVVAQNVFSSKEQAQQKPLVEQSLVKMIKRKLKQVAEQQQTDSDIKTIAPVYNLTVNNFINSNINLFEPSLKNTTQDSIRKNRPSSKDRKRHDKRPQEDQQQPSQDKISRTYSQKDQRISKSKQTSSCQNAASFMKSLVSFQPDRRGDSTSQYKSIPTEDKRYSGRVESPGRTRKIQKSLSFEAKLRR